MSRSSVLGYSSLFILATLLVVGYMYEDSAIASEPVSITIESNSTGLSAENEVRKVYDTRKIRLSENLDKIVKDVSSKEQLESLQYAFDSIECMDNSMKQYPKLIEVIKGSEKSAQDIYKEMEGNCVEDILFYLKRNHPTKFTVVHKAFLDAGFVIPQVED